MKIKTGPQPAPTQTTTVVESKAPAVRTYTINLPSNGQLYGGKKSIELTFFTTLDIKRLYDINKGTATDSIEKLVGSKILDFNITDMTVSDFWYVLYYIRINSFEKYPLEVEWDCTRTPEGKLCGTKQTTPVTGDTLIIQEIDKDYTEPVFLKLPNYGEVAVRRLRIADTMGVESLIKTKYQSKASKGDEWLMTKAAMLANEKSLYENYLTVKGMTTDDIYTLDAFDTEYAYGVSSVMKFTCTGCQEVSLIPFQVGLKDFFPNVQSSRSVRDAIRFVPKS